MPLGKEAGLGPGHIVLDGDPMGTQRPAQQPLPTFRPMSIVAKRSPISATAELLLNSFGETVIHRILTAAPLTHHRNNKNSSGDEIANVKFYAVRPEATRIR